MNRRSFAALTVSGFVLPLITASSRAAEPEKIEGRQGKPDAATQTSALSANEIIARVEAFYSKVTTFQASFRQYNGFLPKQKLHGSVVFERPGNMSWRYTSTGDRVVSDGARIEIYERETRQMYDQDLERTQYPAALSFLTAQGKLTRSFKFSKLASKLGALERNHVLLGEPLQHSTAYERLPFHVDARTYEVHRVLIMDAQGNRNRIGFFRSVINARVPQGEFSFSPPPSTQIIHL